MRGQIIKFMDKSQPSKLNLQLAPIPENFERDSDISLLLAQAELVEEMFKVTQLVEEEARNRINGIEDLKIYKELKESHKHIGLLSYSLDRKLDAYKYHFGETDSYKEACLEHADFLEEHETLINQFFEWIEAGD